MSIVNRIIEENTPGGPAPTGSTLAPSTAGKGEGFIAKAGRAMGNLRNFNQRFAAAAKQGGLAGVMDPNNQLQYGINQAKGKAKEQVNNLMTALMQQGKFMDIESLATIPNTANQIPEIIKNFQAYPEKYQEQWRWALGKIQNATGVSINVDGAFGGSATGSGSPAAPSTNVTGSTAGQLVHKVQQAALNNTDFNTIWTQVRDTQNLGDMQFTDFLNQYKTNPAQHANVMQQLQQSLNIQ